jgi:hypothetical protein
MVDVPTRQAPAPTGSRPEPGTEEWRRTIEALLRLIFEPIGIPADHLRGIERRLEEERDADPEAFLTIFEGVQREFGAAPDSAVNDYLVGLTEGLIDALSGADSGRARNILNDITENRTTTEERQATEDVTITGEEDVTTGRREPVFIEWDTPEAILDDFMTAVTTWVDTALRAGEISVTDYSFVLANPERFLTPYLAEIGRLAELALAGEGPVPSMVVGLEGAAERLGERFGGVVTEETTRVSEQERISDIELNELIESTIERLTSSMADDEPQDITENIRETIENVFREHRETTTSEQFRSLSTTITIEEIFGRPRLGDVRDPSPLDFLRERFPAQTLANLVAGEGGPPSARAGGARAVLPSAPRRLGG